MVFLEVNRMSNRIILYTKLNCPFCVKAKQLLQQEGYLYEEMVIESDISRADFISIFPTAKTVPYILVNGDPIGGYEQLTEWIQYDRRTFLSEGSH